MDTLERYRDEPEIDPDVSEKSRAVTLSLAIVLGVFGGHRFYVGKIGTGILQMCTLGGMGMWYLYDLILVAAGSFRDKNGRRIEEWGEHYRPHAGDKPAIAHELMDELYALRTEVDDLHERVEFAERLLTGKKDG